MSAKVLPEINVAKAHAVWEEKERSRISTPSGQTVYIDSPAYAGGAPKGPAPTEMMMCAYAGATALLIWRITQAMGVTIKSLDVDARGTYSPRGIAGMEGHHPRFTGVEVEVRIATDASAEQLEEIKAGRRRRCPVYSVLAASGAEMKETWSASS